MRKTVAVVFGTRPEAIKLAPVIRRLLSIPDLACHTIVTGQHRDMLDQVLPFFGITPDVDLDLMKPDQDLADLTARAIKGIDRVLRTTQPDLVLAQGDTTTTLCAAIASYYNRIPLGHVEAGLRTGNPLQPWPEEGNRTLTSRLATLHFAPTNESRCNLIREGIADGDIETTGNTVIDSLLFAVQKIRQDPPLIAGLHLDLDTISVDRPMVLITAHRRESFGIGFDSICSAVAELANRFPNTNFVYPVHPNRSVREPVNRILRGSRLKNVHLINPVPYPSFIRLLDKATIVLTDSGGVQEEAPTLGKPVLVMRSTTERPESVAAGTARLVGTDFAGIVKGVDLLLRDPDELVLMSRSHELYGDGHASERIVTRCLTYLKTKSYHDASARDPSREVQPT